MQRDMQKRAIYDKVRSRSDETRLFYNLSCILFHVSFSLFIADTIERIRGYFGFQMLHERFVSLWYCFHSLVFCFIQVDKKYGHSVACIEMKLFQGLMNIRHGSPVLMSITEHHGFLVIYIYVNTAIPDGQNRQNQGFISCQEKGTFSSVY